MPMPPKFMGSIYPGCPDDDSLKNVYLEAYGKETASPGTDRHVLLWWRNSGSIDADDLVRQIVQLTGGPGCYAFYSPFAERGRSAMWESNQNYLLIDPRTA
ncbi:hypothetical protein H0H92_005120 [Tricholoma furcatifolium]|nr:hypothetical protein H0H92_005120 [Tricholoma furcatifolium]